MTSADFLDFYPQFAGLFPNPVMEAYVASANVRFEEFDEDAEEARRLFVAHKLTLYSRAMPPEAGTEPDSDSASDSAIVSSWSSIASAGDGTKITSKKVDDVSITYASGFSSSAAASSRFGDLNETVYGLQLLSLLRLHSLAWYLP